MNSGYVEKLIHKCLAYFVFFILRNKKKPKTKITPSSQSITELRMHGFQVWKSSTNLLS